MNIEPAMSELPATELEAIKQRCEKATAGPWDVPGCGGGLSYTAVTGPEFEFTCGECGFRLYTNQVPLARLEDASFIALARTDIPKLLTEIERLKRTILELRNANIRMIAELTKQRGELEARDWTATLIDRLNELVRENRKYFSECSDGPAASRLIQEIHGIFNGIKHERDTLTAELASAKADTARLDWWDRERPLTHNELRTGHIVLAMEDGCSEGRTIRQAIDAALASGEGKGGK